MVTNDQYPVKRGAAEARHRILAVASVTVSVRALLDVLENEGIGQVEVVDDPRRALPAFREVRPDLVLLDACLEPIDAASLIMQLDSRSSDDEFLPFFVLSCGPRPAELDALDPSIPAFFSGAEGARETAAEIRRLLAIRDKRFRVGLKADGMMTRVRRIEQETAARLAEVAQLKDHDGQDHVYTVGRVAGSIADELGLLPADCELIRVAAPLHDIGMIGIPDEIWMKDGPLSLDELDVMKTHTTLGARILANGSTPMFQMAEEIALYHHENWDGTGYTPGLTGEAIPLAARIVRVADLFDAATRPRLYDAPWTREETIAFIRGRSGHFFDPSVVSAFLAVCDRSDDDAVDNRGDVDVTMTVE